MSSLFSSQAFVQENMIFYLNWQEVISYSSTCRVMFSLKKKMPKNLSYHSNSKFTEDKLKHLILFLQSHPTHHVTIKYQINVAVGCKLQIHRNQSQFYVKRELADNRCLFRTKFIGVCDNVAAPGNIRFSGGLLTKNRCPDCGLMSMHSRQLKSVNLFNGIPIVLANCCPPLCWTEKIKKEARYAWEEFKETFFFISRQTRRTRQTRPNYNEIISQCLVYIGIGVPFVRFFQNFYMNHPFVSSFIVSSVSFITNKFVWNLIKLG